MTDASTASVARPQSLSRLSFGYTSIDHLVHPYELGYGITKQKRENKRPAFPASPPVAPGEGSSEQSTLRTRPIVTCIAGPDGVGKSILALSAASLYAAAGHEGVRVIYASTDLNFDQAESTWKHFCLGYPKKRRETIREAIEDLYLDPQLMKEVEKRDNALSERCELEWTSPFTKPDSEEPDLKPFGTIFEHDRKEDGNNRVVPRVSFLDLASYSAGDDWGLINHALGLLSCRFKSPDAPHLLVVDAVEGLEAMAGNYDRFGLNRSRRSRLAQLVRLARKVNCHIVFVVEQKRKDERLDEVFVSDLVLRLRADQDDEYLQKSIEVEKARSVPHIRGVHELQIRDGLGVGAEFPDVPDDPALTLEGDDGTVDVGYLQVIPSLHQKQKRRQKVAK